MKSIGDLYNSLHKYHNKVSKSNGTEAYPIHKRFNSLGESSTPQYQDVNDWLLAYFDYKNIKLILDAGCGVGATSIALAKATNCQVSGITLSHSELNTAKGFAEKLKLRNCTFSLKDMGEPGMKKYDLIIAIESIKHVSDLRLTIHNLANSLNEKGKIVVVEDLLAVEGNTLKHLESFKKHWMVQKVFSTEDYEVLFKENALKKHEVIDFTRRVRSPNNVALKVRFKLMKLLYFILPFKKMRSVVSIFLGGFILDHYYSRGQMKYQAIIYSK
jgi:2-polyprenyl-3-methyl-5-hydroxy-6-metoxy-1,4-benzoquinol methylase